MGSTYPQEGRVTPVDLTGVGAFVTGAGGGFGEATARRLHAFGAHVVLADIADDRVRRVADDLGDRATAVHCDVAEAADVAAGIAAGEAAPRGLRIAVACAGIGYEGVMLGEDGAPHELESFEQHLRINVVGTFNVLRLAAASMRNNEPDDDGERGVVVLTGSVNAYEGAAGEVQYSASKGAVHALTLPAARELGPLGVRVNTIAPGPFATIMLGDQTEELQQRYEESMAFPKRFGFPSEFASLVEQLVTNHMFNGSVLRIDGAGRYG